MLVDVTSATATRRGSNVANDTHAGTLTRNIVRLVDTVRSIVWFSCADTAVTVRNLSSGSFALPAAQLSVVGDTTTPVVNCVTFTTTGAVSGSGVLGSIWICSIATLAAPVKTRLTNGSIVTFGACRTSKNDPSPAGTT